MDMTRRGVVGVVRDKKTAVSPGRREKRRLIQLVVSLCLFLVVFVGQGAFPAGLEALSGIVARDADFSILLNNTDGGFAEAISKLSALFGYSGEDRETQAPVAEQLPPELPEIVMLSETEQYGFAYIRANSFLRELQNPVKPEAEYETQESVQPEVGIAVAQAYSPAGEVLPANVSFQYYELGLEKTVTPVMGAVTSEFGYRIGPISGKKEFHLAVDIAADKGTEILAFADGTVRYIGENPDTFGLYVMIDHANGVSTFYAHCSKLLVRKGETVTCGQVIALVGETGSATGPHLHFTLAKDSVRLDPAFYVEPS